MQTVNQNLRLPAAGPRGGEGRVDMVASPMRKGVSGTERLSSLRDYFLQRLVRIQMDILICNERQFRRGACQRSTFLTPGPRIAFPVIITPVFSHPKEPAMKF